jgi:UDP-2,3-diacylglucosamine pyrophosphatase LpxH
MRKKWTPEEVATLTNCVNGELSNQEIAEKLGRTRNSVEKKIRSISHPDRGNGSNGEKKKLELSLQREINAKEDMQQRLQQMIQTYNLPIAEYFKSKARFGVVSDTHLSSLWERVDLLEAAYQIMHKEGIKLVYHCGDMCEGSGMRKCQEYEITHHGADAQVAHVHDVYPYYKGMVTKFVVGSHDLSFKKNAGHNIGPRLAERDDLVFLGGESVLVPMKIGKTTTNIEINHPGGGTAQTISWKVQQYINSLSGGRKPEIMFLGHYHKAEFLPYRNVMAYQAGCLQSQTDWMRRKNLAAVMGFWMVEIRATKKGIGRVAMEWTPFFEM